MDRYTRRSSDHRPTFSRLLLQALPVRLGSIRSRFQGGEVNFPPLWPFPPFRHLPLIREVFGNGVVKFYRVGILLRFRQEALKKGKLRGLKLGELSFFTVVNIAAARFAVGGLFTHQHSLSLLSWPIRKTPVKMALAGLGTRRERRNHGIGAIP